MQIKTAEVSDAATISKLAHQIWPITYKAVIPEQQISFMLAQIYSISALGAQMEEGQTFLILYQNAVAKGFASFNKQTERTYQLQKLYIHQTLHQKGAGRSLLLELEKRCKDLGATKLILNVNRNNSARFFYHKLGYQIVETVDIPYHHYVLNDYIMAKSLL